MEVKVKVLASGLGLVEGPVLRQASDIVVTSISRGHLYRLTNDGTYELFAVPGGGPNGATEGINGSIYIAQNGGRGAAWKKPSTTGGIQAVRPDGRVVWITMDLVSPNDLCFGPDGLLYVTDPTRGGLVDGRLWRVNVDTSDAELLTSTNWYPNGIGFGPEDDALYVASSRDATIRRLPLGSSGLGKAETVLTMTNHVHPDGFAFDDAGNIVIAAVGDDDRTAGNVQVWTLEGKLLDIFKPGSSRYYTNVAISTDRRLIITEGSIRESSVNPGGAVLLVEDWPHAGLPLHPFRKKQ